MIDQKPKHILEQGIDITIHRQPQNYHTKAIISKIGKTLSDYSLSSKRMLNVLLESDLKTGELVTTGEESYLIHVVRKEIIEGIPVSIIAHGYICNALINSSRKTILYDDYGNPIEEQETEIFDNVPCRAEQVNGKMREMDTGLLDTTVMKVYCPNNDLLEKGNKAEIAGRYYRVDDIDRMQIPGAMVLQLGVWTAG